MSTGAQHESGRLAAQDDGAAQRACAVLSGRQDAALHAKQGYLPQLVRRTLGLFAIASLWLAVQNVAAQSYLTFEQRSEPQGIFTSQGPTNYPVDAVLQTVNASLYSSGYSFAFWLINSNRAVDILGQSLPVVQFTLTSNTVAIAQYFPPSQDVDGDGYVDFLEWRHYGTTNGPPPDSDADGFVYGEELARGYCPVVHDTLADGGVMLRLSVVGNYRDEAQMKRYEIRSDPQGIVAAQIGYGTNGVPKTTPSIAYGATNGYYFGYWEVDGVRQASANGVALPAVVLPMTNDTVAVARFFVGTNDADGDSLVDWEEWYWFGHTNFDLAADPDGDGFAISEERTRGYNLAVQDELADGAVMLRLSDVGVHRDDGQMKRYEIRSEPQGIVTAQIGYTNTGAAKVTPSIAYGVTNGYYFGYWEVDGVRQASASSVALPTVVLPMTNDTVAIARFFASGDADGDTLADWEEWYWFGQTNFDLAANPDGDGFAISEEQARGYNLAVRDELADGGVMLRLSVVGNYRDEAQMKRYEIRSDPQGIVAAQIGYTNTGASRVTPSISYGATSGYYFGYWEVDGVRRASANGVALPAVVLPMTNDTVAVARFFVGTNDADGDTLVDWEEWYWFGHTNFDLAADPDGDGFAISEERTRGYNLAVQDELADGGVMLRLSDLGTLVLAYYPRITEVMVDGSMQVGFAAAGGVARVLSVASNAAPALGDWDGDLAPDLLIGGANGQLRCYRNGGSPRLPNFIEGAPPWAAFAGWWSNVNNLSPALGDWNGDGVADLALGGQTNGVVLINSLGLDTNTSPPMSAVWLTLSNASWASPCLHPLSGTGPADLWVLRSDGTVDLYLNTGNLGAPFSVTNRLTSILGAPVADATGLAVTDVSGDGRPDVLISDQYGSIAEFRAQTNGTFAARGKGFAGTYSGFAERLTLCAGDLDGDGDTDFLGGFAQGGLIYLNNPARHLLVDPPTKTVFSGNGTQFTTRNASGSVAWSLLNNGSGGTINATNAAYVAGPVGQALDVVEAMDSTGLRGRAYVNVINSNDVARAGKAIVVAGRASSTDPVWPSTDYLANYGYNTLLYRGYGKENIQYLSPVLGRDVDGDGLDNDLDALSTVTNLAFAISNWTGNADKLFLYLVDHGGDVGGSGYFRLNPNETVAAAQLDAWLDALQDQWGTEVCVFLDCCNAGSFLDELTYGGSAKRIVIASCASNEPTIFAAGGLVSFSESFFAGVLMGQNLREAFLSARLAMLDYQHGWMDDNQDGVYTGADGAWAAGWALGASFVAGRDVPQIGAVLGGQTLNGDVAVTLWADAVVSSYPIERVWCVVVPPSFQPNPTNPVVDLPQIALNYNAATGRYEGSYAGFTEVGIYKIYYYAQDIWGSISKPRQTSITQSGFIERAIIAVAATTNAPNWSSLNNVAGLAFISFETRRLRLDSIWVAAAGDSDWNNDGTNDVSGSLTLAALGNAITNWGAGANKLTVYLVGNAITNGLLGLNETESLSAAQLDAWLDSCQRSNTQVTVIMDFDTCGGWLETLRSTEGPARLNVASASVAQSSAMLNGGLISFSSFFFNYLLGGADVWNAFAPARDNVFSVTRRSQRAQMDGDGDGFYVAKKDRLVAQGWYIGSAFLTGADTPTIDAVTPDLVLTDNLPVTLWAAGVADMDGISNVWCTVTDPAYGGSGDLLQTNLTWNPALVRYELVLDGFTNAGTYTCTLWAQDVKGNRSLPRQVSILTPDGFEADNTAAVAPAFALGNSQEHNFHVPTDTDWVMFYAPTGNIYEVSVEQLGKRGDAKVEVYYQLEDGSLELIDTRDDYGAEDGAMEVLTLDLMTGASGLLPGFYYVRVDSADAAMFGPGSEYALQIRLPIGGSGGVVLLSSGGGLLPMGSFYVYLGPPQALAGGAGWRVQQLTNENYLSDISTVYGLPASTNYSLTFQSIPGFLAPTNRPLAITADQTTSVMAYYLYTNQAPQALSPTVNTNGALQLTFLGHTGYHYAIEESTNLLQWVPLTTNQVPADGLLRFTRTDSPTRPCGFYRTRLVP